MDPGEDRHSRALERVLGRFEGKVRGIGRRYGLPSEDLDELFQDVRIRLWKSVGDPSRIEELSASYVHRTATSAAIDLFRRERRSRSLVPLHPNLPDSGKENPERKLDSLALGEALNRALERLDDRRRPVLRMYLSGYSHKEIASLLGWSEATVRNLLYRGLAELRGFLSESETEP